MPGPFPVRPRPAASPATRLLVVGVIRASGAAAAERAPTGAPAVDLPRWSPYRLPGGLTRRVAGRLDRLVVERAGGSHAARRAPQR